MLSLIGDVAGQRILDAGCGAGHYARALVERGASVLGIDGSATLVSHSRARPGNRAEVRQHDLDEGRRAVRLAPTRPLSRADPLFSSTKPTWRRLSLNRPRRMSCRPLRSAPQERPDRRRLPRPCTAACSMESLGG
ncbi:class I SAM-dependent methyltransferase [uncultured Friedmanniella sp.]|uniref:class I SAM-dependent methyltransferase n=1 Tax=uncultured Friedmanniella sp. TaxID=335381 RepID=UPI0035C96C41